MKQFPPHGYNTGGVGERIPIRSGKKKKKERAPPTAPYEDKEKEMREKRGRVRQRARQRERERDERKGLSIRKTGSAGYSTKRKNGKGYRYAGRRGE